jgi:NodT family efflux transporter outer membrane factor (OMF) lipoprotein
MNRQKLFTLVIIAGMLISGNGAFSSETKSTDTTKQPHASLKGAVTDYKAEYVNKDWWDRFDDPVLSSYIVKAANANHDLKVATLRVYETKAMVDESFGKEFPLINIGGDFSRQKTSDNVAFGSFAIPEYSQSTYLFPLNVNYELDLWRKNREKTIGMKKELEAVKYDEKAAFISLTSTVAADYFNVIKTDKLIEFQKEIVSLRKEILDLTREKNNYGLCSTTDVILADKALTEAQSAQNDLEKQQNIFLNQLAVLTGDSVDNALNFKRGSIDELDILKDLPQNIKAEVVQARPDILKSEAQLQKARIDVSLARKDFLPDISITGQFGFNANSLSKVFKWDSYIASIGTGVLQNVFSGGQRRARLKAKKYRYEEMIENYQKTILQAFQEVNDSLVSLKTDNQKNTDNLSRINFEQKNLDSINAKYEEGTMSYLDTLQYKERLISLKKEQIQSKTECLIDSLSLYKATGGKL